MPDLVAVRDAAPWFRRLFLPTYRPSDVARYTRTTPQVVANWHYRAVGDAGPALPREQRRRPLSYLELVETAIVAVFREFKVPLESIRRSREYMQQNFNSEFPFAEYRFKTDGYHLLMNLTEILPEMDTIDLIVADRGGQMGWGHMMEDRLFEFDYDREYELALRWFVAGRNSRVVIDPRVAFGAPMIGGIPTWVLKGRWVAGETLRDIREDFGLQEEEIEDGLAFEGVKMAA